MLLLLLSWSVYTFYHKSVVGHSCFLLSGSPNKLNPVQAWLARLSYGKEKGDERAWPAILRPMQLLKNAFPRC